MGLPPNLQKALSDAMRTGKWLVTVSSMHGDEVLDLRQYWCSQGYPRARLPGAMDALRADVQDRVGHSWRAGTCPESWESARSRSLRGVAASREAAG